MASKIVEAAKNLYRKTVQAQEQATRTNLAAQQAEYKKVTNAAKKVYSNLQQQQETAARTQVQQNQTRTQQGSAASQRLQAAVQNLYQQAATQQRRAVQADVAVRQAENQRVQDAVRGLYSAYQQQQEQQTINQIRQAQEERAAAQRLYSGIRESAETGQRNAAQADMAVQQAQSQRLQSALQAIYNASVRQQEQQARAQEEQDRARMAGLQGVYSGLLNAGERNHQSPSRAYNGEYMAGVLGKVDERESSLYTSPYAEILTRQDYAENSRPGESKSGWGFNTDSRYDYINDINGARETLDYQMRTQHAGQDFAKYALMTDDEIGVYNYLYKTEGRKSADAYLQQLEPELNAQWFSGAAANNAEEATRNAGTAALYSAATVMGQPVRTLTSAMANVEDAWRTATGQGIDPYSDLRMASMMTNETRGAIAGKIEENPGILGEMIANNTEQNARSEAMNWAITHPDADPAENPFLNVGKVDAETKAKGAAFVYQNTMSMLDSAVNAVMAKGLAGAAGLTGDALMKATNVIGSLMMSSEVMSLSTSESKQKGYSDAGALTLGLVRGAIEYASEAIGGEWVISNIKNNPLNLVTTMVLNMIPEGVEEVMSDAMNGAVNLIIDQIFGTQESGIPALMEHFRTEGSDWQKTHPELATVLAILGQEGLSFLGGAFATLGSSATQYSTNINTIDRAARQLNTSREDVVQLMERYDTDNPGQIEALAEIFDAGSVDELTERMAENETAEEVLDRIMREQGQEDGSAVAAEEDAETRRDQGIAPYAEEAGQNNNIRANDNGAEGFVNGNAEINNDSAQNENAPGETRGALEVDTEGVLNNGEQSADRGQAVRNDALSAGGEAVNNEARQAGEGLDAGDESSQRRDRVQNYGVQEEVTPAALGVDGGSTVQNVQVLDESTFETGSPEAQAAQRARDAGLEPVLVRGPIQIGEGETAVQARGYIRDGRVILQADANVSAGQILDHELYHQAAQRDPQLRQVMREALANNLSDQELSDLVARYISAYDGVYDFSNMTQAEIERICEEELFADLYAGIDNTGRNELREDARRGFAQAQEQRGIQTEAEREIRGPTEGRAHVDEKTKDVVIDDEVDPEQLKDVLEKIESGEKGGDFTFAVKRYTPDIYVEKCHMKGRRSLVMTSGKAAQAMRPGKDNHNLGNKKLFEILEKLDDPDYIVYEKTGRNKDHYAAIITLDDKNAVAAVDLGGYRRGANATVNGEDGYYDVVITAYDELDEKTKKKFETFEDYILSLLDSDNTDVVYDKEEESRKRKEDSEPVGLSEQLSRQASESSNDSIRSSSGNSNPQNGSASVEVPGTRTEAEREAERIEADIVDELTREKAWEAVKPGSAIDIMPGEGEEAASSVIGLTDDEAPYYDGTFPASDLFGPTNAEKEAEAMATATKEGNAALKEFAESMPDDPMDLYKQQDPVKTKKIPGQGKISTGKAAEEKTMREKATEAWHGFIRSMVNEADAIHQAGRRTGNKALDGMYFYAKAATLRAQQWIQGNRMDFNLENSGAGLNAIFDPIRAKGNDYYRDFQLYVYHTLNVERMSRSFGDEVRVAKETLNQLLAADHTLGSMSDEELQRRARQYEEGGGLGYMEDEEKGELIYDYWKAKQELQRAEKAQNKPIFGFGEDSPGAEESAKIARDLLAAHPDFEKEAQGVYDYCDALLQYRVDAGMITEANRQTLKSTYPHYVPVMYDYENVPEKIRKGGISVSSTVKGAKGGSTNLLPLHYALSRQTLAVMRNAGYQQLGAEVLKEYENNTELMGKYVLNAEENEAVWDESMADNDDVMKPHENVISVFRDGIRYDLTLSKDMSFAFNSLQPGRQDAAGWQMMAKGNDLFKKLCTAYNPLFMITNPIRDVQDAVFYSTDTARWMKNYPKAIAQIAGSGKFWQMYKSMGGVNNSYFDWATGENAGKRNGKLGRIEALNMAIEQAPRLAEFMTVLENAQRKNGEITQADRMEAFNAAAEITTNFSRGGTQGKWINRNLVPFWNPGVQGLSKAVRTVTETKGFKAWAVLTLKAAALGMLPELLNGLLYRDDDEWDVIDDQMKMDYYLFKGKDGVWIKVPKGRVLAALSAPVVGMQESLRGDDVDWGGLAKSAFGSVAPNNPFESNLFSTAMQAQLFDPDDPGKTWYGGNIESKRLQQYAPGERYDESTDILSKWLGGKLNISPKKLSYVLDQYSGVLGDLILPYLTPKAERGVYFGDSGVAVPFSNAFMSRFTMDTVTSNTISDEYYGLLDELGYAAKAGDKPSAVAERYLSRAGSTISDYYAQIREIENDTNLSDAEKSRLTRELRKKLNEYEQQITADAAEYLESAQKYLEDHPEFDYTDDAAVNAFVEGYNSQQSSEKYYIDADTAASKMKDEVYREVNREHFGAEYALQAYSKDTYAKARELHDTSGVSYDDFYDYYFGTRYMFADKDTEGKPISGTKSDKIVEFLEGKKLSDEHRNALYQAAGFSGKYPAGITSYLESHPEYDFSDGKSITAFMEGYNSMQSSEKYYIDEEKAKSKMRDEVYREIYRDEYGAEYALQWYSKDTYKKATELKNSSGLSYDDYYDYFFGTRYLFADKDENGKTISGSRKEKIVDFIDGMDIPDKQKDALYIAAGYTSKDIKTTPWHGGSGKYTSGGRRRSRGGRRGGRRSRKAGGSGKITPVGKITPARSTAGTLTDKVSTAGSGSAGKTSGTSAGMSLLEIVNRYYDGNPLAAAMDGGRKARTSVDFKL